MVPPPVPCGYLMNNYSKLLDKAKQNPQSIKFKELTKLATLVGFIKRKHKRKHSGSSHEVYTHPEFPGPIMNFQRHPRDSKMAKDYQVKQLLKFIRDYNLDNR